ncbi:hypothetical protein [Legionella clemsonensis]|uniref:hypothetical protein n=1 Tax=Legionella clemsonensis TaxID=1867846 RepID=UPI001E3D6CBE|nr:hypothetical protein [Legionella clemsonensis]
MQKSLTPVILKATSSLEESFSFREHDFICWGFFAFAPKDDRHVERSETSPNTKEITTFGMTGAFFDVCHNVVGYSE